MQNTSVSYNFIPARYRVISGSVLKTVAVVTMLIDHIGAGLLLPLYLRGIYPFGFTQYEAYVFYRVFRSIGRVAFPIYCFLLVEALFYTTNRLRYFLVMLLFALLSELPFDLALSSPYAAGEGFSPLETLRINESHVLTSQNVFLTLALGFLCIWGIHAVTDRLQRILTTQEVRRGNERDSAFSLPFYLLMALASFLLIYAACVLANVFYVDYKHRGILLIVIFYLLRRFRPLALAAGFFYIGNLAYMPETGFDISAWSSEFWSFPAFLLLLLYNEKRGFIRGKMKYAFYAFYPVHLLVIYAVRAML